ASRAISRTSRPEGARGGARTGSLRSREPIPSLTEAPMKGNTWASDKAGVEGSLLTDVAEGDAVQTAGDLIGEDPEPPGTLFFMILVLLIMVGLWVTVYWMLLER